MTLRSLVHRAAAAVALAGVLGASASAAPYANGRQDLDALFAPPTAVEIAAVEADWAGRPVQLEGWRLEGTFQDSTTGFQYDIVSHVVDGQRHYAGVRYPENYVAGQKYATVVLCHGGLSGVFVQEVVNFLTHLPGLCVSDEMFLVIPSYRGEPLTFFGGPTWISGGTPSPADRDVDDTIGLLEGVLQNYPDVDPARVASWGVSRGGAVALLLAIRDDRIRRTVDMFGFTDLSLPTVRARVDAILNNGAPAGGLGQLVIDHVVNPYLAGAYTLAEARLEWLKRSPCYFATGLRLLQVHHGMLDTQVDPSHSQVLLDELQRNGFGPPDVTGYFYSQGQHSLNLMPGHGDRVEAFLCDLQNGPRGYCGPMLPHANGLYARMNFAGEPSVTGGDFRLRVRDVRPNGSGLFFVGDGTGYYSSGAGYLCLDASVQRLGVATIDANGLVELPFDLANPPASVAQFFAPGSTAYVQFVFRDLGNPLGAWNFSNGLEFTVEP